MVEKKEEKREKKKKKRTSIRVSIVESSTRDRWELRRQRLGKTVERDRVAGTETSVSRAQQALNHTKVRVLRRTLGSGLVDGGERKNKKTW